MNKNTITHKMYPATLIVLRLIAAYTGEKQPQVLDRVLRQELDRIQTNEKELHRELDHGTNNR